MTHLHLTRHPRFSGVEGPVVLVILDGVGLYPDIDKGYPGNAFGRAFTPNLDRLLSGADTIVSTLKAHGRAVGLPSDADMGNSEVGHNAMGAGRIFDQGAMLVNRAIESRGIFEGEFWKTQIGTPQQPGHLLQSGDDHALHFIGLLSDGNVHSHIDQLLAMIAEAARVGVPRLFVHPLADGRDVDEISVERYIARLDEVLQTHRDAGLYYYIASGGGRMKVTMDRYEADWSMVELGWKTHVAGDGPRFADALTAVEALRAEHPGIIDQDLPAFVIHAPGDPGTPMGPIRDDDVVVFFNFRGDRAIEMSRAFTEEGFDKFTRNPDVKVRYAGLMEYDGDLHIPPRFLVEPPAIDRTIGEYLAAEKIPTYALSETQKFGHVTYFWNGNNSEPFDAGLETWEEIPSDRIGFEFAPGMKAAEITDALIAALKSGTYRFLRVNYPNGDMVGHTGVFGAAVESLNVLDRNLGRLLKEIDDAGATMIVLADHGNCEQMYEVDKTGSVKTDERGKPQAKTSHTLNPVPFVLYPARPGELKPATIENAGLANLAATLLLLLGYEKPDEYLPAVLEPAT